MRKIALILIGSLALSACAEHVRDEVRQVEVVSDKVDEDLGELHVTIRDVDSNQSWDVNLGEECGQYPLPRGEKFMARFDVTAYEDKPKELYYAPYSNNVWKYLCS